MKQITLLGVVLAAAGLAACDRGQGPPPDKTETPAASAATSPGSTVPPQLLALLPKTNDVPGWEMSTAPRAYDADTLFELIDGAADGFLTYGFQAVVAADYKQAGTGAEVTIEAYQMKDPLNAFGKYAEERSPDATFLQVGHEGYADGTTLNFWSNQYYVKITAFEEKDAIAQEMAKLATSVASKVATPGAEPAELSWFPKDGQIPHTGKYIPKDVLAQSYLNDGFEVHYKGGTKESRLVLVGTDSTAAAGEALTRYRQSVAKNGKDVRDVAAPGDGGFVGKDSYYGNVVAVRAGNRLAVALGVASEEAGRKQLADLVRNLR